MVGKNTTRRDALKLGGLALGATVLPFSAGTALAESPSEALVNAEVTGSGAVVATGDDFVISGQEISVDGGTFFEDGGDSYVIYNDGYSGEISGNTLTVSAVRDRTFGIHVGGGDVKVTGNTISAADDILNRFIAVAFTGGATGQVGGNEIAGTHRVGVLARGTGTDVEISGNTTTGPGPRSEGWADNGVQVDQEATGQIRDNTIDDHWYAPNTFVSSGLLAYADDVVVQRNHFGDNDLGIALSGDRNNVIHNTVEVTYETTDTRHYGVYELGGTDNGLRQNTVTTEATANGLYGIIVLGDNAKLIRNELDGWADLVLDAGDGTKLPKPFDPDA